MIEDLLREIATLRGGPLGLYKPVIALEWYEHDDVATVRIGRCKGLEEIVYEKTITAPGTLAGVPWRSSVHVALEGALEALRASGAS